VTRGCADRARRPWLPCRFPGRMYAPLGADLYIVKLRAALTALGADVHCLVGSVRPDTVAALRCLLALREGRWMRQAEALPSSQQVRGRAGQGSRRAGAGGWEADGWGGCWGGWPGWWVCRTLPSPRQGQLP